MQRTALCARKIAAILKLSIVATAFAIYRCAAAEAQTVGRRAIKLCFFNTVSSCHCRTLVLHSAYNHISILCISGVMQGSNLQTSPVDWLRMA
jgi:hypothetical protein